MGLNSQAQYDVVIVGGGVSGTALLYVLSAFTDLKRLALLEKYADVATVNSRASSNSQTIHCGEIETNYSLQKALTVRRAASMITHYAKQLPAAQRSQIVFPYSKMVLGVGSRECDLLRQRFEDFRPHYPGLRLLEKAEIQALEPKVVQGQGGERPEDLVALGVTSEYSAVNYGALAHSFLEMAQQSDKQIDLSLRTQVLRIEEASGQSYELITADRRLRARMVVVCAGGHSLLLAHQMGHGLHYSCLPMAGSFYFTPAVLNGKVYTVQNDNLPFAAIHGDPDVLVPGKTRFGPTALPLPLLERYNPGTLLDFLRVLRPDAAVAKVFWDLFKVRDIRNYLFKNMAFEIPRLNRHLFLKDARKIVPTLQLEDLEFAKGYGGVRPQLIDKQQQKLILGQAKINPGAGLIFNVTPSPGATYCLGNAEQDAQIIAQHLGCTFSESAFAAQLVREHADVS